jgi:hypothetical protein
MKLAEHDSKYDLFVERATGALAALGAESTPVKAAEIYEWVRTNYPKDVKLLDPSWGSHLSGATQDQSTRIRREPGRYTYRLLTSVPAVAQETTPAEQPPFEVAVGEAERITAASGDAAKYTRREAALYPALCDWLSGRKFRAEDTSRSKAGGTWGNPDVTGLRLSEGYLGRRDIEVATVEVKTSMAYWRQYIFEAISHKRFAHRAYFAFAFSSDEPSLGVLPDVDALRHYAERFRVGIAVVFLPIDVFKRLHAEKTNDLKIDSSEVRVEELWPAVYEDVRQEDVTHYLWRVLGLETDEALYEFGRE